MIINGERIVPNPKPWPLFASSIAKEPTNDPIFVSDHQKPWAYLHPDGDRLTKIARLPTAINGARALLSNNDRQGGQTVTRTKPPFRADHVGSLLRPPELLNARDDFAAGRISSEELRRMEDGPGIPVGIDRL